MKKKRDIVIALWKNEAEKVEVPVYRYGFNGKEKDESGEFGSLTTYDYGFRIYNPGIGRFLSVDPLTASYPWYTPYQFAGNKPIWAIDIDGLEDLNYNWSPSNSNQEKPTLNNGFDHSVSPIEWYKLSVIRGEGHNAPYKYFLEPVTSFSEGKTEYKTTSTQEWAIAKARAGNGSSNILADRLFQHFIKGGGNEYKLNEDERALTRPYGFSLEGSRFPNTSAKKNDVSFNERIKDKNEKSRRGLVDALSELNVGETKKDFIQKISAGAQTNGTLGEFTIIFEGELTKTSESTYSFKGTFQFNDSYDFDPRWLDITGLRSSSGEQKVRKVRAFQVVTGNGANFEVTSEKIQYEERNKPIPKSK